MLSSGQEEVATVVQLFLFVDFDLVQDNAYDPGLDIFQYMYGIAQILRLCFQPVNNNNDAANICGNGHDITLC